MVNSINSSLLLSSLQTNTKTSTKSDVLGKDDFLKILMTQLQNQDPLNPMQDKEFIAQMATFTSLEQITNIGKSVDAFVQSQQQNQLVSYNQYIGKDVDWQQTQTNADGSTTVVGEGSGKVVSLKMVDNAATFILEDGTAIKYDNILQVNEASRDNQMLQASQLIGKTVTYTNEENGTQSSKVVSASFKDGKTTFQLENNDTTRSSDITKIEG